MYAIFNTQFKFYFTRAITNKHKKNVKKLKMSNKLNKTVTTLSIVFLNVLISFAGTTQQWKDIKVDVKATGTVSTTKNLKKIEVEGFSLR